MEQKQYNHIEQKIIEAADGFEPAFNDVAWDKMEQLLDSEKDKDRKPLFWLWLLLPLVSAGIFFFLYSNKSRNNIAPDNNIVVFQKTSDPLFPVYTQTTNTTTSGTSAGKVNTAIVAGPSAPATAVVSLLKTGHSFKNNTGDQLYAAKKIIDRNAAKMNLSVQSPAGEMDDEDSITERDQNNTTTGKTILIADKPDTTVVVKKEATKKENNLPERKTAEKKKGSLLSKLYLTASAGAENSGTKLLDFKNGKIASRYGFGIGYSITDRLQVHTGFYTGHKIYDAPGSSYNPKQGSYLSRVKLISLTADCNVYEIPVTVQYNFLRRKKTTVFAAAGIASYIMQSEDYDYRYTRNNIYFEHPYTYKGNRHFAAAVNLSAGVERKLSDKLSVQAQPSVSLPLKGVGDGRVKLYSASLNAGIKYFPFRKK